MLRLCKRELTSPKDRENTLILSLDRTPVSFSVAEIQVASSIAVKGSSLKVRGVFNDNDFARRSSRVSRASPPRNDSRALL